MNEISKDEAIENVIKTSSGYHALFMSSGGKRIGKAIISKSEIYHKPLYKKYERSIHLHEISHINFSARTQNLKFLCLLNDVLSIMQKEHQASEKLYDFFGVSESFPLNNTKNFINKQSGFFSEVHALFLQLNSPTATQEIKEQIIADIKIHEPKKFEYLIKFNEVVQKFLEAKKERNNMPNEHVGISYYIYKSFLDMPVDFRSDFKNILFNRFNIIYNAVDDIPKFEVDEQIPSIIHNIFAKEGCASEFVSKIASSIEQDENEEDIFVDKNSPIYTYSIMELLNFINMYKFLQDDISKPFIFGILKEYDKSFYPIVYEVNDLENEEGRRIKSCYLEDSLKIKDADFPTFSFMVYPHVEETKLKQAIEEFNNAIHKIKLLKINFKRNCPHAIACKNKKNCNLSPILHRRLIEIWHPHAIKIEKILGDIFSDDTA